MFEGIFTTKTKKKNDERFVPGQKEGVLFGGNYEDTGFLPIPSQFISIKKSDNSESDFDEKVKKFIEKMALK